MNLFTPAEQAYVDQVDADAPPFSSAQLAHLRAIFAGARP